MGQFLDASISALNSQGDPTSVAAATTLGTLKSQITTSTHFKFGDILEGNTGGVDDAADAKLDILNLVGMASSAANGTNLLNMTLPITIPGVTSTTMKLALIEGPQICWDCRPGSTPAPQVHTGQVRIQLDSTLTTKLTVLLQQGTVHLPVYLESAGATGLLTDVRCANPLANSDITVRTTNQPVTAKVGTATDSSMNDPSVAADVRAGQIVSITGVVNVTGTATASMPSSVTDLVIPLLQTMTAGSSGVTLASQLVSSLALTVQVLTVGVNATTVANNTLAIVNPVLSGFDTTMFGPLKKALGALGISFGAADVTNMDEDCTSRRLIG
jgi:tight adherence protein G